MTRALESGFAKIHLDFYCYSGSAFSKAESHGYNRKSKSYALGRNFEGRIAKFCTNVDDHRFMRPIDFHVLHEQASYILMTIK